MMKIIKRISCLVAIFIFTIYNVCFADLVISRGGINSDNLYDQFFNQGNTPLAYILIGILVLVVVTCAIIIIKRMMEKKKEKENVDNK